VSELRAASVHRVRAMWATLAGAERFPETGAQVITNPDSKICPPGWAGVVAIGDGIIATVPSDADLAPMSRVLECVTPDGDWEPAFAAALERHGPANLAYRDNTTGRPDGDDAIEPHAAGDEDVLAFLARTPAEDREEAGIEACTSVLACIRRDEPLVAAAGHRVWLDEIAHLSVLVDPRYRGRQLATMAAASATEPALAQGFLAQWRARPPASRAVARKLGYVDLGRQISLRLA